MLDLLWLFLASLPIGIGFAVVLLARRARVRALPVRISSGDPKRR